MKRERLMPIMCTVGPGMEAGGTLVWCHRVSTGGSQGKIEK